MNLKNILKKIAHFQVENPILTLSIIFIFSLFIWGGISEVKTVASLEKMMPKDIEEIRLINELRDNGMGQDMLALHITLNSNSVIEEKINDIRNYKVYEYLLELEKNIQKEPDVLKVYSYAQLINLYNIHEKDYNSFIQNKDNIELTGQFINKDYSSTVFIMRTDVSTDDQRMVLLSNKIKDILKEITPPSGIKVELTGTPIIQQKLGELIELDRKNTQWISMLLVFIITALVFRSFTSAIVPIIVVFLSVNWLYGTMGYVGLPISTLAGGVAAMVVGIGIDFAIHIMNKFRFERKEGKSIKEGIELAVVQTGTALLSTSITTIAAFLTFIIGVMPEMGRFGMLMAIGIFYSLVFSLFGLPALLVIEEKIIHNMKNKKFGIGDEMEIVEVKQ